jgi:hypothetical protein
LFVGWASIASNVENLVLGVADGEADTARFGVDALATSGPDDVGDIGKEPSLKER